MDESMSRHPENPNTLIDPYPWANAHPPIRGAGAWVYVGEIRRFASFFINEGTGFHSYPESHLCVYFYSGGHPAYQISRHDSVEVIRP